jgi:hypothetical protein
MVAIILIAVFWLWHHVVLLMITNILEKHATSILMTEVCSKRNWLSYMYKQFAKKVDTQVQKPSPGQ